MIGNMLDKLVGKSLRIEVDGTEHEVEFLGVSYE